MCCMSLMTILTSILQEIFETIEDSQLDGDDGGYVDVPRQGKHKFCVTYEIG